jgi:hypothetical protein
MISVCKLIHVEAVVLTSLFFSLDELLGDVAWVNGTIVFLD